MSHSILVVDDETRLADVLAAALEDLGYRTTAVDSARAALEELEQARFDLVLTDLRLPVMDGRALLREVRRRWPEIPVVIITAFAAVRDAVELVKEGAFDYIAKPFEMEDVAATLRRALRLADVVRENDRLRGELEGRYSFDTLIGSSPAFRRVIEQVTEVCETRATVMLNGESGTGKELVARALHDLGSRRAGPFVPINMAAIPRNLVESELFGHEKGAFVGADSRMSGRFEQAEGGSLFLDEVGDMPPEAQTRLLRVLQDGEYLPVGANRPVRANVRIIAATNHNLQHLMQQGLFREDLFYRLNVVPLRLPPLRERTEDIAPLVNHFLKQASAGGLPAKRFSPDAIRALAAWNWPGNVRELENLVRRLLVLVGEDIISADMVDSELASLRPVEVPSIEADSLSEVVEQHIR